MDYQLDFFDAQRQLVRVTIFSKGTGKPQSFKLPIWRPGRYEMQRFDKLIADVVFFHTETATHLPFRRISTHEWQIQVQKGIPYILSYVFYANQRDSGGSAFDSEGIYINPANLLMYEDGSITQKCKLALVNIPKHYQVVTGLERKGNVFLAKDYHELIDSPFFAGGDLQLRTFQVKDLTVHLCFLGECQPDWEKFEKDIRAYTEAQFAVFGDCPVKEYYYLCQILPYKFRHGVEHQTSSVNTFGPGYTLMRKEPYESFIELLSHEFFHTWNVKFLRPADMYPYDYGRFQYSELHYVTEGITSYYGDFMLLKAGIYDVPRFLQNLNIELSDHHLMAGRNYISLAEASFNSWVNGYGAETGIPSRKISFYTKGYIVAFLLDYTIRKNSQNKFSLDNVMREMYQKIGKAGRGYTKADFKSICEKFAGVELGAFFADYYDGVTPIDGTLREAIKYYGLGLKQISASNMSESVWGLRLHQNIVEAVIENSPAAEAGITKGAEIVAVAGHRASAEGVWQFVGVKKDIEIHYFYLEKLKKITLKLPARIYLPIPCVLEFATFPIENWEENRAAWLEPLSK